MDRLGGSSLIKALETDHVQNGYIGLIWFADKGRMSTKYELFLVIIRAIVDGP